MAIFSQELIKADCPSQWNLKNAWCWIIKNNTHTHTQYQNPTLCSSMPDEKIGDHNIPLELCLLARDSPSTASFLCFDDTP